MTRTRRRRRTRRKGRSRGARTAAPVAPSRRAPARSPVPATTRRAALAPASLLAPEGAARVQRVSRLCLPGCVRRKHMHVLAAESLVLRAAARRGMRARATPTATGASTSTTTRTSSLTTRRCWSTWAATDAAPSTLASLSTRRAGWSAGPRALLPAPCGKPGRASRVSPVRLAHRLEKQWVEEMGHQEREVLVTL